MNKTIIIYASHDGHTRTIADKLASHLLGTVVVRDIELCHADTFEEFDTLIFGSAIRYGKHLKPMVNFLTQHRDALTNKKTAFFSVNLTARKANRNTPETSNYIKKLLGRLDWRPDEVDVFAGKLDYSKYRFFDKHMIRFIMWLTKGDTDLSTVKVYTDWERLQAFAQRLNDLEKR